MIHSSIQPAIHPCHLSSSNLFLVHRGVPRPTERYNISRLPCALKHLGGIQITCPEPPPLTSVNVENQWLYSELLALPLYVQNINIHPSLQGPVHSTSPHGFLMRTNCTCCPLKLALKNKAHLIGIQCSARFFFVFFFNLNTSSQSI